MADLAPDVLALSRHILATMDETVATPQVRWRRYMAVVLSVATLFIGCSGAMMVYLLKANLDRQDHYVKELITVKSVATAQGHQLGWLSGQVQAINQDLIPIYDLKAGVKVLEIERVRLEAELLAVEKQLGIIEQRLGFIEDALALAPGSRVKTPRRMAP